MRYNASNIGNIVILLGLIGIVVKTLPAQNSSPESSGTQMVTISANSHRPLATSLDQLEKQILKPINFEEVPYQNAADLGHRTIESSSGPRELFFPIGGPFSVVLDKSGTDGYAAARTLINAYNSSGLAGKYQLVNKTRHIDVLPAQVHAADGSFIALKPVMDQELNIPVQRRTVLDTLQLIVDSVSQVAGRKVLLAGYPPMIGGVVEIGANSESASDVLFNMYARLSPAAVSYRLLYDPNEQAYYLTVRGASFNVDEPGKFPGNKMRPAPGSGSSPFFRKSN